MPRADGSLTTIEQGYDYRHKARRRELEPLVEAGGVVCCRCGRPIVAGKILEPGGRLVSNWHLDHHDDDRSVYLGAAHRRCNAAAGARKRSRAKGRVRPRVPRFRALVVSRDW